MKKLMTLSFAFLATLFAADAASAQTWYPQRDRDREERREERQERREERREARQERREDRREWREERRDDRRDRREDRRDWRGNRGTRFVTQTRIVRQGFRTYRETVRIAYLPNGRTQTQVLSRVRIG